MLDFILLLVFSYLLGSIPFGYLITKLKKGTDIRKVGSGSIGGTNVARALGFKWGLLVGILDLLKGVIPVSLAIYSFHFNEWQIIGVALVAVLGHIFPVWLKFKGGKGVATVFGALAAIFGWKIFLIWILGWVVVLAIFQIMSFTNLLLVTFLPLIFLTVFFSIPYFVFGLLIVGLVWWSHRENVKRIIEEREPKFKIK